MCLNRKHNHVSVHWAYRTGRNTHQFTTMINPTVRQDENKDDRKYVFNKTCLYGIPTTYEVNELLCNYSVKCQEEYNN